MKNVLKAISYGIILILLLVAYEVRRAQHRSSEFESIQISDPKNSVAEKLGTPFNVYNCKTEGSPSPLIYADNMCKNAKNAFKVYAFEHCEFCALFAPGWFNVVFDDKGKIVEKYNIQSP